jgi:type IV secretory pathway VirJ component
MRRPVAGLAALIALATSVRAFGAPAEAPQHVELALRGKTITVSVYRPTGTPRGTIIMGSGDVGWVGLGVDMAGFLSAQGYVVAGVNVRQYLSVFTSGKNHVTEAEVPGDYAAIAQRLKADGLLVPPVIVSGVSEGAALAVLAGAAAANRDWVQGVITMGLPVVAELAWKWTDFTAWITKSDAREPSFSPLDHVAAIAPTPLVMIQSTKDEYVPEADYRRFDARAREPHKLVLIEASNHRFTDRRPELQREYLSAIDWIRARLSSP